MDEARTGLQGRPELLKGHIEGLVLAIVGREPSHGYAIMEAVKDGTGGAVELEGGTLYPVLHRMEVAGLVAGTWSVHGGRRRRTYSLTAKGEAALADERSTWTTFVDAIGAVMSPPAPGTVA